MSFPARYRGRCASCGEWFEEGEEIGFFDHELMDEACLNAALDGQRRPGQKDFGRCPRCFQAYAANGTCGCD